jgi:hypothetical protein
MKTTSEHISELIPFEEFILEWHKVSPQDVNFEITNYEDLIWEIEFLRMEDKLVPFVNKVFPQYVENSKIYV